MNVNVELARVQIYISSKIHTRVKQQAFTQFHKTLLLPDNYYEVSAEVADQIRNIVWTEVMQQIRLQVKDNLVDE